MISNFHVHNELCRHASGTIEDYVKQAIKNGYKIIGFSDHGPIPNAPFTRMDLDEFYLIYLNDIKRAQIKYEKTIKIYAGVELEYRYDLDDYYKELSSHLDYMILGTHYTSGKPGYKDKSVYRVKSKEDLIEYGNLISDALDTGYFKILAHPDLCMNGYYDYDETCQKVFRQIIDAVIRNDVFIEYNANGRRRGTRSFSYGEDFKYPNKKFWEIASEYKNLKVVIGSDAHDTGCLMDDAIKDSEQYCKDLGLNVYDTIF